MQTAGNTQKRNEIYNVFLESTPERIVGFLLDSSNYCHSSASFIKVTANYRRLAMKLNRKNKCQEFAKSSKDC